MPIPSIPTLPKLSLPGLPSITPPVLPIPALPGISIPGGGGDAGTYHLDTDLFFTWGTNNEFRTGHVAQGWEVQAKNGMAWDPKFRVTATGMVVIGSIEAVSGAFDDAVSAASFSGSGASLTSLNASSLASGVVAPARGGLGLSLAAAAQGSLLYASGVGTWAVLPAGTNGQVLKLTAGLPGWGASGAAYSAGDGISIAADEIAVDATVARRSADNTFAAGTQQTFHLSDEFGVPKAPRTRTNGAVSASIVDGYVLENESAAILNGQRWTPFMRWTGHGWATDSSTSKQVDWVAGAAVFQGAANPTTTWILSSNHDGTEPITRLSVTQDGVVTASSRFAATSFGVKSGAYQATLSASLSANRTLTVPDKTGTLATLDDIIGGGGGVAVQDEGVSVATALTLNFIGAGVAATDAGAGVVDVTISGGGGGGNGYMPQGW